MPQETERLKLPLPLGNENVTRESINGIFEKIDAGVATQADLDTLREAVSQMDIPDASLTQKGKVQLSSKMDGTSETVAATEKGVRDARLAVETNAKNYADTSFRKPSEIVSSNLIKNSSGMLNLDYWKNSGQATFLRFQNQTVGAFFAVNSSVSPTNYGVLDNEPVGVSPGGRYLLQAVFHTAETYYNSAVLIEVKNASDNMTINSLVADNQRWWHRKAQVITIPTGVTAVYLRLVVNNVPVGTHGFARIKFCETMDDAGKDMPYSVEMDTRALYEGIDSVKQSGVDAKNGIVGAINAKGGSASTIDTWAQLATKIKAIKSDFSLISGKVSAAEGRIDIPGYKPQVFILHPIASRNAQIWYDSLQNQSTAWIYSSGPLVAIRQSDTNNTTKNLGIRDYVTFGNYYMSTGAEFKTLVFGENYVEFKISSSGDGYIPQEKIDYTILATPL